LRALIRRLLESKTPTMSAPNKELIHAVELALAGKWDAAHNVVQQYEDDATAVWIHAVLHKIEGDLGNSRYWYRHTGRLEHVDDEPSAELAVIKAELLSRG
jgi:hypothetical protein